MLKRRLETPPTVAADRARPGKKARHADEQGRRESDGCSPPWTPDLAEDREAFERRRNLIARAAASADRDSLRLLLDDALDRHIKSALYRVIDDPPAVKRICKAVAADDRRLPLAAKVIYRAASRFLDESTFVLVALVGSRQRASIADALVRLVDDDEPDAVACLFGACARAGSRVSDERCQRWARDALCAAVEKGRPGSAEALVHEVDFADLPRLLDRYVASDDGDAVAALLDACEGIAPIDVWTKWANGALAKAAETERLNVVGALLDVCEADAVREALLCCADEYHKTATFEALWEHADACAHDFVERLPRGVGRDFLCDLIDEGGGCEGYCKGDHDDDNSSTDSTDSESEVRESTGRRRR